MLEQQGNAITFLAQFIASKQGSTGLTVTVDVHEVVNDGSSSEIVTGGSATEIGDGVYAYTLASGSVDAEALYVAVFKTSDSNVDQQHIPALWVVNKAGTENLTADLATILADTNELQTDDVPGLIGALNDLSAAQVNAEVVDALTVDTLADSYASDGSQPTFAQAVLAIQQFLFEKSMSGTTVTVKKPDGSTTAMTFTTDNGTSPSSITRTT